MIIDIHDNQHSRQTLGPPAQLCALDSSSALLGGRTLTNTCHSVAWEDADEDNGRRSAVRAIAREAQGIMANGCTKMVDAPPHHRQMHRYHILRDRQRGSFVLNCRACYHSKKRCQSTKPRRTRLLAWACVLYEPDCPENYREPACVSRPRLADLHALPAPDRLLVVLHRRGVVVTGRRLDRVRRAGAADSDGPRTRRRHTCHPAGLGGGLHEWMTGRGGDA